MSEQNKNQSIENTKITTTPVSLSGGSIFSNGNAFNLAGNMANYLAKSTIVPKEYQNNVGNCLIAIDMSVRLGVPPLMVMQNLYVVNGRPAWSSQYIIAMINNSKKYMTELQFELTGEGDNMECYAWAEDKNGHKVVGPTITIKMAKDECWTTKNGSKWKTMPEVMIRYRAASFFGRLNCPDMIMGIYTVDEVVELDETDFSVISIEEDVKAEISENANVEVIDVDTNGVISDPADPADEAPPENGGELTANVSETPFANVADGNQQQTLADLP